MFRSASRAALRNTQSSLAPARTILSSSKRYIGTAPPHLQSRSWRSSAVRWGIAIAGIYYYNTSAVFAENPENNLLNPNVDAIDAAEGTTIDQLTASSKNKKAAQKSQLQNVVENASRDLAAQTSPDAPENNQNTVISDGAQELEQEAEGEGAFNPLTGEINWDCPCLGGMAYGPCGPQFREAFSCFVYSQEEPKGMECVDKFQGMQDCFRAHPEVYKGELEDDEEHMNDVEGFETEKQELRDEIAQRKAQLAERQKADEDKKEVKAKKAKKSASPAAAATTTPVPQENTAGIEIHPESSWNTAGPHVSAKDEANQTEPGQPAKTTVERSEYKQADENDSPAPSRIISSPGDTTGVSK